MPTMDSAGEGPWPLARASFFGAAMTRDFGTSKGHGPAKTSVAIYADGTSPTCEPTSAAHPERIRHLRCILGAIAEGHVDLGDLDAAVAHPVLQRARIYAADHDCAEGVAQIV